MKVEIIKNCPNCDSILIRVKDQLFCKNEQCSTVASKQVENFAKIMKIKGLGKAAIQKLEFLDINEIYTTSKEEYINVLGEKIGTKIYNEVENSKNVGIATFLSACSIPLIGNVAGKKIANIISNPLDISVEVCKKAGLGNVATDNLLRWSIYVYPKINIPMKFEDKAKKSDNTIKVCISGKIEGYTKNTLTVYLESNFNVEVLNNVSAKIDYLICNKTGSSKEKRAVELNKKIVTIKEFMEILNNE